MRLFPHLKIAQKLPLVVLGAALVVGSAIAGASFYFAARALEDQARQNLATIAFERSNQLSTYLSALQSDVARLAKSEIAIQGLHALATAWPQITNADPSTVLRKAYITDNPNAEAERLLLDKAATVMNYNVPHSRYQPIFREQMTTRGYRDLYLFDRQGNLIYTTRKGDDFAMNFAEGAGDYAASALGKLFAAHVRRRGARAGRVRRLQPLWRDPRNPGGVLRHSGRDGARRAHRASSRSRSPQSGSRPSSGTAPASA